MLPFAILWQIPLMSWGGNTRRCPHWRPSWQDKSGLPMLIFKGGGGGGMSNARGKLNNILIKSMMPLMRVVDKLYLADTTEAEAPSMKAVFDSCMTSLSLLSEANLEVETLRRDAFKPTTPRIYKSLISKPGVSKTLLFGDNMEDQMRSLETKEKLQKALEPEKPQKKTWAPSSTTTKRFQPYGKARKNGKGFPKPTVNTTSGKPGYSKKKWYPKR